MKLPAETIVDEKYQITAVIGRGGMGVVYKAVQLHLNRPVALKMLTSIPLDDSSTAVPRFEREAVAINALKHRNIVTFYGYGMWESMPYMVMELLQGVCLDEILLGNKTLPYRQAIALVTQLCQGLSCAHANGVIHRDLKPSNIMLVPNGAEPLVKLIDFGLAKVTSAHERAQQLTQEGLALGSVIFMSPEQCQAMAVDQRSDIYSAGCILQQCLTGSPPFHGSHVLGVMNQHLNDEPPKLADYGLNVGSDWEKLQAVLDKALEKNPDERYQSIDEMSYDLCQIYSGKLASNSDDLRELAINSMVSQPVRRQNVLEKTPVKISILVLMAAVVVAIAFLIPKQGFDGQFRSNESSLELFHKLDKEIDGDDQNNRQRAEIISWVKLILAQNRRDNMLGNQEKMQLYSWWCHQLFKLERYEQARDIALEALRIQQAMRLPSSPAILIAISDAAIAVAKTSPRKQYCGFLLSSMGVRPDNQSQDLWDNAMVEIATCYLISGDPKTATQICRRLIPYKMTTRSEEILFCVLADCVLADGHPEEAVKFGETSLKAAGPALNPYSPEVYLTIARADIALNKLKEARDNLGLYIAKPHDPSVALSVQIVLWAKENQWAEVEKHLPVSSYLSKLYWEDAFRYGCAGDIAMLQKTAAAAGRKEIAEQLAISYKQIVDATLKMQ